MAYSRSIFACLFNTVDFTGVDLSNADFTQLNIPANRTGLTWKQVKSAKYMSDFTLPTMALGVFSVFYCPKKIRAPLLIWRMLKKRETGLPKLLNQAGS